MAIGDEDGGCARIAISTSFPNLLYTVYRSSNVSPLPDTFSSLLFFRDNFDGEVFLYKSAVKHGAIYKSYIMSSATRTRP